MSVFFYPTPCVPRNFAVSLRKAVLNEKEEKK